MNPSAPFKSHGRPFGRLEFIATNTLRRIDKVASHCGRRVGVPLLFFCCIFVAAVPALGQTVWVNQGVGDWVDLDNWSAGLPSLIT